MKKILNTRKKVIIAGVAAGAVVLGTGGAAYAYFTSTGSGTGTASVGSAGAWTVTSVPDVNNSTALLPGQGSQGFTFTVVNSGPGNQAYGTLNAYIKVDAASGNILDAGNNPVAGCQASWFTVTPGTATKAAGASIAHNGTFTIDETVALTDQPYAQDGCQGVSPILELDVK